MEKYRTGALKAIKNVKRKRCRSIFTNNLLQVQFRKFLKYLEKYYLKSNAKFHFSTWCQYSTTVTNGGNYSRTSNVSESIHSSLNKEYNRRISFENGIRILANFKKDLAAKNSIGSD